MKAEANARFPPKADNRRALLADYGPHMFGYLRPGTPPAD
jgi:hypothetical protein